MISICSLMEEDIIMLYDYLALQICMRRYYLI